MLKLEQKSKIVKKFELKNQNKNSIKANSNYTKLIEYVKVFVVQIHKNV